ncbi:integral membrane sensor signal transduction histidine kinase [Segniliparus rotundus DSM 44985]|uniref:histidine kinase n=1 Tax=Segniliparus rotundus (strain ATCC BAA-972 / CDC 1076 / CIP 108378 / DSM 44985 / JCM 13578) TaxID=640132 RepID=D6ZEL2_SEGRD|nr:HAMP domain-containing sensor histidine kinase [Segniliparus rotundus]ADG99488.1 integral membrane sensor signal transduction histidine kinase [Segniliparus rotundus DSM 44985]
MTDPDDTTARASGDDARHVAEETHARTVPPGDEPHHAAHRKRGRLDRWWRAGAKRLLLSRRRSPSLRAQVALSSGIGTFFIVTVVAIPLWMLITDFNFNQADARLQRLTTVVQGPVSRRETPDAGLDFTIRTSGLSFSRGATAPDLPAGSLVTAQIDGRLYRVYTVIFGPTDQNKLAVAELLEPTLKHIDEQHRVIVVVGFAAVVAGGVLGWLLGGFAVRPLRELATATRQVTSSGGVGEPPHVTGAREVEAIAEAMRAMLARIGEERTTSDAALATARDFALLSAHELRTPLTAMRTNLEVLNIHNLPQDDRQEIVGDVLRTQRRVEETLSALEHLAAHELNTDDDYADVNLNDLLDQAVVDAARANPDVAIRLVANEPLHARAVRAGLRLAVDNAITNAIRHGNATRVHVTLATAEHHPDDAPAITITIDDNGCGVPEKQRDIVFRRFVRGTTAKGPGSGLGMALIAQQAQIHHGNATLTTSPQGGARLTITIPQQQPTHTAHTKDDTV